MLTYAEAQAHSRFLQDSLLKAQEQVASLSCANAIDARLRLD
jgi:hypothetical protein